ncbi:nucleotidyl transferase AbiEii/AbiGii toxin family protein [Desulfonatronum thioautotrophicum]|uniref:nucleotidyl transferase AbiEii/AbiGii toxin family protein n=1 Tax=Desulfonatronum thioautotrophicum TaxID=617001 RepID=UPI0005EB1776|nr:nucleotidyl transferase AbiEii/AbiGii toxin family protein [Desulfonatronum thioautotrophicum]
MITIDQIKNYFPASMAENAVFHKHILKEYVQLLTLDYLSSTEHIRKMTLIGGTNLRLVKGIDRFSEDLDFDCKTLTEEEFIRMSDDVLTFLQRSGFNVEARAQEKSGLMAFRRSLYFPELLFNLGISGHREARFLLKIESQDQQIPYEPDMEYIKGCGFYFMFPVPSEAVLCAMKIAAMLARGKGRDYYDVMFLLSRTKPDYQFLAKRVGVHNLAEFKAAVDVSLQTVDLRQKQKDFEHLLFHRDNSRRILHFAEFIRSL